MNINYRTYELLKLWNKDKAIKFYLKRYLYVTKLAKREAELTEISETKNNNYVWTMWLQDDVPEICRFCINTIKEKYPQTIVITEKNVHQYVEVPDYIMKKYKNGSMKACHFSDYVRMNLLDKYGGTWIDATCFLTQPIPKFIMNSEFFLLRNMESGAISNYFIHSERNNYITKCMRIFLEEYWKSTPKAIHYFFFHRFLVRVLVKRDEKTRKIYEKMPISSNLNTKMMLELLSKEFNTEIFEWLCQTSYIHKLSYKQKWIKDTPDSLYTHLINSTKIGI